MATQLSKSDAEARRKAASVKSTDKPAEKTPEKSEAKTPVPAPQPKAQDQSAPAPQDQSDAKPKAKRKYSSAHVAYVGTEDFPDTAKITINRAAYDAKPKLRHAAVRFALYRDGMTVGEYVQAYRDKSWRPALARADIRWDSVKGYITVK